MSIRTMKFVPCALIIGLALAGCGLQNASSPEPPDSNKNVDPTSETAPAETGVLLHAGGIGTFEFGAPEAEVLQYLTEQLGSDSLITEGGPGYCGAVGKYQMYADFDEELKVRFSSEEGAPESPESPRFLVSWEYYSETPPAPPLILSDQIPWGLTWEELEAQYSEGREQLDVFGGWNVNGVVIFPGASDDDTYGVLAGLLDWCVD